MKIIPLSLIAVLVTGLFLFTAINYQTATPVYAAALVSTSVTPASLVAGAAGNVIVAFTVSGTGAVANDGKIKITFPSGFTLDSGGATTATAGNVYNSTTYQGTASGQVVTLVGDSAGTGLANDEVVSLTLANVKNPEVSGGTGTYTIQTTTSGDAEIDVDAAVTESTITVGALVGTPNVEPASLVAGAVGNIVVTFTTANPVANNGKVVITLPAGFVIDSGGASAVTAGGTYNGTAYTGIGVVGQDITLTGDGNGTGMTAAEVVSITIDKIKNPAVTGDPGAYTLLTTTNGDVDIDTAAPATDTITVGALSSTNVEPATLVAGASGTATVTFTTANPIPANGNIKVTFGAAYNVSGAAGGTCTTQDGTFVTSVASQVVTLTRQNDGASEPAGAQTCTINTIVNPPSAGTTGVYNITTTDTSNVSIDTDAAVTADTITPAPPVYACSDGIDNNGNGLIDFPNDPYCSSATDTLEAYEGGGSGGGGGGGGASTSSASNTTTTTSVANIETITGDQSYSSPIKFDEEDVVVDTDNNTATIELTGDGSLTLKPNSGSTISVYFPPNTDVTGPADWNRKIDPPVLRSLTMISSSGEPIEGSSDPLMRDDVEVAVKVGSLVPLQFSNEATLNIPIDLPRGSVVLVYTSLDGNNWEYATEGVVADGMLVTKTDHFSYFAFVATGEIREVVVIHEVAEEGFADIVGHWSEGYVNQIDSLGIVSGKTKTTYAPNDNITRAELTKIAAKAFDLEIDPNPSFSPFGDVPLGAWYAQYVIAARQAGIVQGVDAGNFAPDEPITRSAALKILLEAKGFTDIDSNFVKNYTSKLDYWYAAYQDVLIGEWYAKYVAYANNKGIVGGYEDGSFGPNNSITRAEVAKIVVKIIEMPELAE